MGRQKRESGCIGLAVSRREEKESKSGVLKWQVFVTSITVRVYLCCREIGAHPRIYRIMRPWFYQRGRRGFSKALINLYFSMRSFPSSAVHMMCVLLVAERDYQS